MHKFDYFQEFIFLITENIQTVINDFITLVMNCFITFDQREVLDYYPICVAGVCATVCWAIFICMQAEDRCGELDNPRHGYLLFNTGHRQYVFHTYMC